MASCLIRTRLVATLAALAVTLAASQAQAQIINFVPAGVEVDAEGVLRARVYDDSTGQLTRQRFEAAQRSLPADLQAPSKLRKVSLNRLEARIAELVESGEPIDDAIRNLAGLTRITHVFFYPETGDIVIAGPAEGFFQDASGRTVGMTTGQAILQLEDFVVALRCFAPGVASASLIGCSIDPTREGLARFQEAVTELQARTASNEIIIRGNEAAIMQTLRDALGRQTVTVQGVPTNSHFAQVLVEADYRMKLIGIGLEKSPVEIPVWAEHASARGMARNAMVRWYFTPDYQRISVNPDETAMELVGHGVKLITEAERVSGDGKRAAANGGDSASRNFARVFTEKYEQLAERSPVFAQLRNLIDMAVVAAFIKEMDYYGKSGWNQGVLADEAKLPVGVYPAPAQVEPMVNGLWKGNRFSAPIGGGVVIQPRKALDVDVMQVDEAGKVDEARAAVTLDHLADGQWWWD